MIGAKGQTLRGVAVHYVSSVATRQSGVAERRCSWSKPH